MGLVLLAGVLMPDVSPPLTFLLFVLTGAAARYAAYAYDAANQSHSGSLGYRLAMVGFGLYGLAALAIGLFDVVRLIRVGLLGEFLLQFLGTLGDILSNNVSPAADHVALIVIWGYAVWLAALILTFIAPFVIRIQLVGDVSDKLMHGLLVLGVAAPVLVGICLAVAALVVGSIIGIRSCCRGIPAGFSWRASHSWPSLASSSLPQCAGTSAPNSALEHQDHRSGRCGG
jgi:hypothetical protein